MNSKAGMIRKYATRFWQQAAPSIHQLFSRLPQGASMDVQQQRVQGRILYSKQLNKQCSRGLEQKVTVEICVRFAICPREGQPWTRRRARQWIAIKTPSD